jgi:hypothetical protein
VRRQKTTQAEQIAFSVGERGALVENRVVQPIQASVGV